MPATLSCDSVGKAMIRSGAFMREVVHDIGGITCHTEWANRFATKDFGFPMKGSASSAVEFAHAQLAGGGNCGVRHLAVIMDGNGRWATARGLPRIAGHRAGVESVRRIVKASIERQIGFLTIYSFLHRDLAQASRGGFGS